MATSGPTVHLLRAVVGPELRPSHVDAEQLHVHVLMWMVDSRDRCVGGVSSWPAKEGTARPVWNSARRLSGVAYEESMALRIELWHSAASETLVGVAKVALSDAGAEPLTAELRSREDTSHLR